MAKTAPTVSVRIEGASAIITVPEGLDVRFRPRFTQPPEQNIIIEENGVDVYNYSNIGHGAPWEPPAYAPGPRNYDSTFKLLSNHKNSSSGHAHWIGNDERTEPISKTPWPSDIQYALALIGIDNSRGNDFKDEYFLIEQKH